MSPVCHSFVVVMSGFYFNLYDLDRIIAFIKHSNSSEINCYHVRVDPEFMRGCSRGGGGTFQNFNGTGGFLS